MGIEPQGAIPPLYTKNNRIPGVSASDDWVRFTWSNAIELQKIKRNYAETAGEIDWD